MGLNVSALADFNNEVAGLLIPKIIYAGNTAEYTSVKEGIKYLEPLNLFEVDLTIQNGYGCATTPAGSAVFTQRNLQVCGRQSFDGLCLKELDTKYLGISSLGLGEYNTTWELANTYSELLVNQMRKSNDTFIWQAVSGSSDACADGLLRILSSGSAGSAITDAAQIVGTTAATLANMDNMIAALPSEVADRSDLTFFMSVGKFRQFVADVRTANSYYFNPDSIQNRGGVLDMVYPYQNVRVAGVAGITSDRIVLGPAKQIVVGTDLLSDTTEFSLWYDINTDQLRHRISTKLGVQVAYPEFWISNNA